MKNSSVTTSKRKLKVQEQKARSNSSKLCELKETANARELMR